MGRRAACPQAAAGKAAACIARSASPGGSDLAAARPAGGGGAVGGGPRARRRARGLRDGGALQVGIRRLEREGAKPEAESRRGGEDQSPKDEPLGHPAISRSRWGAAQPQEAPQPA